jgi:four helix bundle protein
MPHRHGPRSMSMVNGPWSMVDVQCSMSTIHLQTLPSKISPTPMPFKFEQLDIWKLAIEFADEVHLLTRGFPKEELFSLTSQFKRAADSVSLNIAEGSIGQSDAEQKKFVGYSIRSLAECVNCLYLSNRRNYISHEEFAKLYRRSETLFAKLNRFRRSLGG